MSSQGPSPTPTRIIDRGYELTSEKLENRKLWNWRGKTLGIPINIGHKQLT